MESQQIPKLQHSVVDVQINNKKLKFPKFGCFRIQHDAPGGPGDGFDIQVVDASGHPSNPTHLIIMVNGLIGRFLSFSHSHHRFPHSHCLILLFYLSTYCIAAVLIIGNMLQSSFSKGTPMMLSYIVSPFFFFLNSFLTIIIIISFMFLTIRSL